ncbi:MAG: ATP-binding protein [Tannerellaceae bacterium]
MQKLLTYFEVDWAYIGILREERKIVDFPCEVVSPWFVPPTNNSPELSYETIPWIIETIKSGRDIVLNDVNNMPKEIIADRELIHLQQLKSTLIIPLSFHNQIQGFIGFDSTRIQRNWSWLEIENLHIIANIFSIIIERWETENNMEQSRKRLSELSTQFKSFFDELPLGVELYDANGTMIDANEADAEIFGTVREKLIGVNLFENPNLTEETRSYIKNNSDLSFSLVYKFNKVKNRKYYKTYLENQTKYLQVKGHPLTDPEFGKIGYLFIVSDNTESTLKAGQTENNLATLKAVLLNRKSLIGVFDIEKEEIFFDRVLNGDRLESKTFRRIWNRSRIPLDELLSFSIFGDNPADNFGLFRQIMQGKSKNCSITFYVCVDGETNWFRINAQAYQLKSNGIPSKIICYIVNITQERELQRQLINAQNESRRAELEMQKAREADQLKSAFLANMSHEIRTPLNAIVGFSSIIAETENADERNSYMKIVSENNDLLLRLITDILDFSKIESGVLDYTMEKVSLKEICTNQHIIHSEKAPKGVEIRCPLESLPDCTLFTDYKRISQVISNLLSNAVKFTSTGTITLTYKQEEKESFVRIEVIDTGVGIAKEHQAAIFERFVKVNNFKQGTGLGLCICKTIVETLGGKIGVESEPGKGSTFWFTLPLGEYTHN